MEWGSSRCGSWEREGEGLFGLRQWRHICESCLIEMKVGLTWKIKIMAREFCCSHIIWKQTCKHFIQSVGEYIQLDALAVRAISSYTASSVLWR